MPTEPPYTRFIINAGYAESARAATIELWHDTGFSDVMGALRHLVETLKFVSDCYPKSSLRYDDLAFPDTLFLYLHTEELDILSSNGVESHLRERGWVIFPDYEDHSKPVHVQNFIRLIDDPDAYVQWQIDGVESNSFREIRKES